MAKPATAPKFEQTDLERKIRSDLNLEKRAIWQPSNSNTNVRERTFEETEQLSKNETVTRKIQIMATGDKGLLTTEDLKTYYALIEQWQEHGRPDGYTAFSLRKIAKRLGKHWSKNVSDSLTNSLLRLRFVGFIWTNSYYNSEKQETEELVDTFNILPTLKIWRKKKGEAVHGERAFFRFHDLILTNIENNYSKPVILPIHLSIKSEVGQILYGMLDRILSKKKFTYQKRTKELFEDLGLEGEKYKYRSGRKQILDKAVSELKGLPMSNGATLETVKIIETKDKKDFKLIAKRGNRRRKQDTTPQPDNDVNNSTLQEEKTDTPEGELIAYFVEKFTFGDNTPATQGGKQYDQAKKIIKKHGEEMAKYIIEFASREAQKTRFPVQVFGAVFKYEENALNSYRKNQERIKREAERDKQDAERRAEERRKNDIWHLKKQLYKNLTPEQLEKLTKKFEKEILEIEPFKSKGIKSELNRSMFDHAVRSAIETFLYSEYEKNNE